ncbi:LppP/LprE family lipoprotein [Actinomyces radicidentis]|uniref:LppP/LprE family lipoprotein n=1 Tax=Actinomyces radicidentis TaxID=111015 RepID=UPI0028E18787|nr:LppP/LprE family lipoprotein [Actinomyces radicidentis]
MTPTARSRSLSSLALAAALSLAGCGGTGSTSGSGAASASAGTTASASASASSASTDAPLTQAGASTSASSDDEACGTGTAEEAIASAAPSIKYHGEVFTGGVYGWDHTHYHPTSTYDPCATLSWVELHQAEMPTTAASWVLLFHKGTFVSTARQAPVNGVNSVDRVDDSTISITYGTPQYAGSTEGTSTATSTYTWDADKEAIARTGDILDPQMELPSTASSSSSAASTTAAADSAPVEGAYAGAGGDRPASAVAVSGDAIVTPRGNIGCDFSSTVGNNGCGVLSYIEDQPEGVAAGSGHTNWWIYLDGMNGSGGVPEVGPRGDAPAFASGSAMTVDYGQVVYSGDWVCASEEAGLTCWNDKTGHGAFMNRSGTETF